MRLFTNASLPTGSTALKRVNVLFDEQIIKISTDEIITEEEPEIIDLKGKILLPGAIDIHSHIITDDETLTQDLLAATKSAIKGGWTCLSELSYHTSSPIFDSLDLKKRISMLKDSIHCDMALWAVVVWRNYPYKGEGVQRPGHKGASGFGIRRPWQMKVFGVLILETIRISFRISKKRTLAFPFKGLIRIAHLSLASKRN